MSNIRPWHLFLLCAVMWTFMTIEAAVERKYFTVVMYFLIVLINGLAAYTLRKSEN